MTFLRKASSIASNGIEKATLVTRQAIIYASKNLFDKSFSMLNKLKKHPKFVDAAYICEAQIYQNFLKDPAASLDCFIMLSQMDKTPNHFVLLGDAQTRAMNFDAATESYRAALDPQHPSEAILKKLVNSLVSAHRFDSAVSLFKSIVPILRGNAYIPLDLVKLMIQLHKYDEAQQCLTSAIRLLTINQIIVLADYQEQSGITSMKLRKYSDADNHFRKAQEVLSTILEIDANNVYVRSLRSKMSKLCVETGQNCILLNQRDKAVEQFHTAISYDRSNPEPVMELFNLFKMRFDTQKCQTICHEYLQCYPQNEAIALLITSIETRSLDYNEAIKVLENVLAAHPRNYRTLVRLVEICARAGRLNLVEERLKALASDLSPGMTFVRGIYSVYNGHPQDAILLFEKASKNHRWELSSKLSMIQLLINPDQKYIWLETTALTSIENLERAQDLFNSIRKYLEETEQLIISAQIKCAYNTSKEIEEAAKLYKQVMSIELGNIAANVGIASCNLKVNDFEEASRHLDFVLAGKPFHENFTYFEEAYLMKAHIVETQTNYTSAQHLIFLALDLNMCCKKGWEMSAQVHLKNKMYNEAMLAYSHCWILCGKSVPEVGYNYAYASMMANHFDEAITICRAVLNLSPMYKDLKEKILIPSFRKLKTT